MSGKVDSTFPSGSAEFSQRVSLPASPAKAGVQTSLEIVRAMA
jgi:hypothetical protein